MVGMETVLFSVLGHFSGCVSCSNVLSRRGQACCAMRYYAALALQPYAVLLLVSSFCKPTNAMRRANELCWQAPRQRGWQASTFVPCSSTKVHRHSMNTLRFTERSESPDLLGKLRRSPAQTCNRVDSLSSRTTRRCLYPSLPGIGIWTPLIR